MTRRAYAGLVALLLCGAAHPMTLGTHGEKIAAKFLKRRGYRILARNYRCGAGEIDLVAAEGDTLVFVEVKTRARDEAAHPEASVNFHKRRRITRAAKFFIAQSRAECVAARFDVLAIVARARGKPEIEHFIDAFGPTPR